MLLFLTQVDDVGNSEMALYGPTDPSSQLIYGADQNVSMSGDAELAERYTDVPLVEFRSQLQSAVARVERGDQPAASDPRFSEPIDPPPARAAKAVASVRSPAGTEWYLRAAAIEGGFCYVFSTDAAAQARSCVEWASFPVDQVIVVRGHSDLSVYIAAARTAGTVVLAGRPLTPIDLTPLGPSFTTAPDDFKVFIGTIESMTDTGTPGFEIVRKDKEVAS